MTAHQITRIAPSKYRRELVSLRVVLVATLRLSDQDDINFISMLWQAAEKLAIADSSPIKRLGMTKNKGFGGTCKLAPSSDTFQTRFPQPPRQTWRPAFAIAAAIYPAGRCSNAPGGPPRANLSNCNQRNRCHAR